MKNLIILGVPRAGKSTLAKYVTKQLISEGVPVVLMPADSIVGGLTARRAGFMWRIFVRPTRHIFPCLLKRSKKSLENNLCRFIKRFVDETSLDFPIIFEGAYISPSKAEHMFDPQKCKIVVVGYPNATLEEKIKNIRQFDDNTAISKQDDITIKKTITTFIKISKQYEKESKNKFVFLDTSKQYHKTLCDFAKNVSEFLTE